MEVLDLVQSAASKSGIISSFNPDELPGDIIEAGRSALLDQILPGLNCDRTIDITVTSRVYKLKNNRVVLTPLSQPNENLELIGYSVMRSDDIDESSIAAEEVYKMRPDWRGNWPTNDFGECRTAAFWTADMRLLKVLPDAMSVDPFANIDFNPMRVDAVLDDASRAEYTYAYRDEFERITSNASGVFTVEEYEDSLIVLVAGTSTSVRLVLPVPLTVTNVSHDHAGTIHAPVKFKNYLIDCLAVNLAIMYGVSTIDLMRQEAAKSYNLLKKNKTQQHHAVNVNDAMRDCIRRNTFRGIR